MLFEEMKPGMVIHNDACTWTIRTPPEVYTTHPMNGRRYRCLAWAELKFGGYSKRSVVLEGYEGEEVREV